jgi:hypothetical protein
LLVEQNMPLRQDIQFLRERARRLREIAASHPTALSGQLRQMADELEARAEEIEQETGSNAPEA